jgi:VIT1/CCC1 family predicted Fe2+/Mn2+ transporter
MPPVLRILLVAVALLLILGAALALFAGVDPPISRVEQVIPNDRFAR